MEIVPVLDLLDGQAVHAIAGDRANYQAVESPLGHGADPVGLARRMVATVGASSLYVADLGAITGGLRHAELIAELGHLALWRAHGVVGGVSYPRGEGEGARKVPRPLAAEVSFRLYWDAGLRTARDRAQLPTHPNLIPVWGSETADPDSLAHHVPVGPAAFSVDLASGVILGDWRKWGVRDGRDAAGLAARGVDLTGADTVIVLDLRAVGVRRGPIDGEVIGAIRARLPAGVRLGVGGGVRHDADLTRLEGRGVDFALIASAIHDGTLTACRRDTTGG